MWFIPPWVQSSILLPCPPFLHTNLTLPMKLFSLKSFCVLLCSLNITSSESINILAKGKILSFCDKQHLLNYIYIDIYISIIGIIFSLFIHHLLDTDSPNVTCYEYTTNMCIKISQNFAYFFSFGYIPSTRIDSSQGVLFMASWEHSILCTVMDILIYSLINNI